MDIGYQNSAQVPPGHAGDDRQVAVGRVQGQDHAARVDPHGGTVAGRGPGQRPSRGRNPNH